MSDDAHPAAASSPWISDAHIDEARVDPTSRVRTVSPMARAVASGQWTIPYAADGHDETFAAQNNSGFDTDGLPEVQSVVDDPWKFSSAPPLKDILESEAAAARPDVWNAFACPDTTDGQDPGAASASATPKSTPPAPPGYKPPPHGYKPAPQPRSTVASWLRPPQSMVPGPKPVAYKPPPAQPKYIFKAGEVSHSGRATNSPPSADAPGTGVVAPGSSTMLAGVVAPSSPGILHAHDTPASAQPPRAIMRELLLRLSSEITACDEHTSIYWHLDDDPRTCPWRDFLLTLDPKDKEIVFGPAGVREFGICSFPGEKDPNTRLPRVDFLITQAPPGRLVRLHPGKKKSGDAKPVVGDWSLAVQNRYNYTMKQANPDQRVHVDAQHGFQ